LPTKEVFPIATKPSKPMGKPAAKPAKPAAKPKK
jgi:hypothetical protein